MEDRPLQFRTAAEEPPQKPDIAPGLRRGVSLSALARDRIRAGLTTGKIHTGKIYSVPSLASELGVSATPVREAMLELVAEGLFEVVPNRGFSPIALSEGDLDEIFELRLMLEVPAMGRVADVVTPECAKLCRGIADQIAACGASGDVLGFLEADRRFHLTLLGELGNSRLVDLVGRLRDQTRLFGLPQLAERRELGGSAAEHYGILEAISSGDSAAVKGLTRQHLRHTRGSWAGQLEHGGGSVMGPALGRANSAELELTKDRMQPGPWEVAAAECWPTEGGSRES